jgi:hypothetical protein
MWLLVTLVISSRFTASVFLDLVSTIGFFLLALVLVTVILGIEWLLPTLLMFTAGILVFLSLVSMIGSFLLALVLVASFPGINLIRILTVTCQSIAGLLAFLKVEKLLVFIAIAVPFQVAVGVFIFRDIERVVSWFSLVGTLHVPRLLNHSYKYLFYVPFTICDLSVQSILLKLRVYGGVGGWLNLNT